MHVMVKAHRLFAVLLAASTIAVSYNSASLCNAFKPSSRTIHQLLLSSSRAVSVHDPSSEDEGFGFPQEIVTSSLIASRGTITNIHRGGHSPDERGGEGRFIHLRKATVVRYHGYLLILLAVMSFLETVGVKTPLVGPTAILPGFNPQEDDAMKFIVRFSSAVMLCRGFYEIEFSTSLVMQRIFLRIVSLVCVVTSWTMWEIGGGNEKWLYPGIAVVFLAGFLLAK